MFEVKGEPWLTAIKRNAGSGITVALVNIPLSISLAVASDASPAMGIITAIWAGTTTAFLGGSHYNIVGPTGALSGLLSIASVQFGQDVLPLLAIMAGLMIFVVFMTNMDKLVIFVPANTMQGFTIAVAIIIAFNQINFAMGLDKVPRHPFFVDNVIENLEHAASTEWQAVVMFLSFFTAQIVLARFYPRIPWAIVMACTGITLGYLSGIDGIMNYKIRTLDSRFPGLELSLFSIPSFKTEFFKPQTFYSLSFNAMSIAFVGILETLISAKIADRMTKTRFNQRQEVFALSIANVAAGFFGGIPATAALARTALNIKSGATSRVSGIISSLGAVVLSLVFLPLFKYLPLPNIAAILVNVGIRMIEFDEIYHIYHNKKHFLIMVVVTLTCVFVDPTSGIIMGILLSLGKGAVLEARAWVLCKLRRGKVLISDFHCDLEVDEKFFETLPSPPALDLSLVRWLVGKRCDRETTFDDCIQRMVFSLPSAEGTSLDASQRGCSLHGVRKGRGSSAALCVDQYHLVLEYKLAGSLTCVTAATHARRLGELVVGRVLLNLSRVHRVDVDGVTALEDMVRLLESSKKLVYICGIHGEIQAAVERADFYEWMSDERRILRSYGHGLAAFEVNLEASSANVLSPGQRKLERFLLEYQHLLPDYTVEEDPEDLIPSDHRV